MERTRSRSSRRRPSRGFAVGAEHGYIYMRGEYPLAAEWPRAPSIRRCRRGYLGADVMGLGFDFDHRVRASAPAPTSAARRRRCSTRSRAFAASRGPSRRSPSRSACSASRRWSTTSRRSSTCCPSCSHGGRGVRGDGHRRVDRYQAVLRLGPGRRGRACTSCRSAPRCASCSTMAGGVVGGRPLQAVLMGGAAGAFLTADELDTPLTFEGSRAVGATLGSGVVMVLDDTVDLRAGPGAHRRLLPRRVVRPVRAVPGRHACARWSLLVRLAAPGRWTAAGARAVRRPRRGDARRVDLRPRADRMRARSSRRSPSCSRIVRAP